MSAADLSLMTDFATSPPAAASADRLAIPGAFQPFAAPFPAGGSSHDERLSSSLAVASCLALMRAGEQSAAQAFARIMTRLSPGEYAYAAGSVKALIEDEMRHDVQLSESAAGLPFVNTDFAARHFFRRLETRDPGVHLARIAALDACSCQLLSRMLAPATRAVLPPRLANTLASIRRDEGSHVRTARRLAGALGVDTGRYHEITRMVRHAFAGLIETRAAHFEALGIDSSLLIQSIDRDRSAD